MFLPPEQRQPRSPWEQPPPKRELTRRERWVVMWAVGFVLVIFVVAPIGGSTVIEALWYMLGR